VPPPLRLKAVLSDFSPEEKKKKLNRPPVPFTLSKPSLRNQCAHPHTIPLQGVSRGYNEDNFAVAGLSPTHAEVMQNECLEL